MKVSELLTYIKNTLGEDGVYRSDAFLLERLNEGYKLVGLLSLFDERPASITITGTRNFVQVPTADSDYCIAPLYVSDGNNGRRVNPCKLEQFEFYATCWEGTVDSNDSEMYVLLSPFNYAHAMIGLCPISDSTSGRYNIIGAFVPATLTTSSTIAIPDSHVMVLHHYTRFMALISEPGRHEDAGLAYQDFVGELDALTYTLKFRFPSGRDHEPFPVEFIYDAAGEYQPKRAAPKQEEDNG